jgi:hypothetical protein
MLSGDGEMPTRRKAQFIDQLPATPCTPKMRQHILEIAEREGTSIAEIQRKALALFLSKSNSKPIGENSKHSNSAQTA